MKKIFISIAVATIVVSFNIQSTNASETITPESSNIPTCLQFEAQGGVGSSLNEGNPMGVCKETRVQFGPWHSEKIERSKMNLQNN